MSSIGGGEWQRCCRLDERFEAENHEVEGRVAGQWGTEEVKEREREKRDGRGTNLCLKRVVLCRELLLLHDGEISGDLRVFKLDAKIMVTPLIIAVSSSADATSFSRVLF